MTTFVGHEYLIGNAFLYLTKERHITLEELHNYREKLQQYWNSHNIDAVFVGELEKSVWLYQDCFELKKEVGLITLKPNVNKKKLERWFIGYLPLDVLFSFKNVADQIS